MMMKKIFSAILLLAFTIGMKAQHYTYKSVDGDPLKTRIYTLKNGLTIYLSDNSDMPRIQTYIAVRAGGKNDPHESTGLAHYLEHLMFKGTTQFGTSNYAAERPILDQIEAQYEVYGKTTDPAQRKAIYHVIDSLSYAASQYAIANEYDKLMAAIGSNGSNAYTTTDVTCYTEDIPANEVERWARIQSKRFTDMVIRGFHTELEAVYEEYNMSLTQDIRKISETINETLFPHHPYGMQTVIGTQEHLKNPSLENVKNYYHTWYVPNNVAVCMSGDLGGNPDSIVSIIDKYFGQWQPNTNLPTISFPAEADITAPIIKEVRGREREMVALAWRMPKVSSPDYDCLEIVGELLSNGKAGLFDLNLNQGQLLMGSQVFVDAMNDYSALWAVGLPKEGQTLEEVRSLLLSEVQKLKKGEFPEAMLQAIVNNMKRSLMEAQQSNENRASQMVEAFVNQVDWKDEVEKMARISRLTKEDIMRFANTYLTDGYVCVNKMQGEDPNEKKIDKPLISPIEMNRDKQSDFVSQVLQMPVRSIEPKFIDFEKDMTKMELKDKKTLLYKHNDDNDLFQLYYILDFGNKKEPALDIAASYIDYLGTKKLSAEALKQELYKLACDVNIRVDDTQTAIAISGLNENMTKAMHLAESWINEAQADDEVLEAMIDDILKSREDDKLEQQSNSARLLAYGMYGSDNSYTHILSAEQLKKLTSEELLNMLSDLKNHHQTICYYGPCSEKQIQKALAIHKTSKTPLYTPYDSYAKQTVSQPEVLIAPYNAKNIHMFSYSNNGQVYDPKDEAKINLFNEYFGGGMNGVVFQELRESRGLAYQAGANYDTPSLKGGTNCFYTRITTQNDKMSDCIDVFNQIITDMPLNESAFQLAKDAILKRLATERTLRIRIPMYYLALQRLGLDYDPDGEIYSATQKFTLQDLADFHKQNVKNRTYRYLILGDEKELDMKKLEGMGAIKRVSTSEIFGY